MSTHDSLIHIQTDLTDPVLASPDALLDSPSAQELERQVEFILDDCFFTLGQVVGMRTTVDYEAVTWIRDHFRVKFLAAMTTFGNRWVQDRSNVTSVVMMLGERAVRYAEADGKSSIDVDAARRASAASRRASLRLSRRDLRSTP